MKVVTKAASLDRSIYRPTRLVKAKRPGSAHPGYVKRWKKNPLPHHYPPPISNEVRVQQSFAPKNRLKDDSPSSPQHNRDSIQAVTSALKANQAAFKGQLPESLRGGVDEGDDEEEEEEEEEEEDGEDRPLRLIQDPFDESHLSGRRPSLILDEPTAITGQSQIFSTNVLSSCHLL